MLLVVLSHFTGCASSIQSAAYKGDTKEISRLLDEGADVNEMSRWHYSPLIIAAMKGRHDVLKLLIERGAEVNKPSMCTGETALIAAAFNNRVDCVNLLLEKGADIDYRTPSGMWAGANKTALECAALYGHTEVVKVFQAASQQKTLKKQQEEAERLQNRLKTMSLQELVNFNISSETDDQKASAMMIMLTGRLIEAKNCELLQFITQASVSQRVALLTDVEKRLTGLQAVLISLNATAEDAFRRDKDTAVLRQQTGVVQAYMSVLKAIQEMLSQS